MALDKNALKDKIKSSFSMAKDKAAVVTDVAKEKAKDGLDVAREKAKDGSEKANEMKNDLQKAIYKPLDVDMLLDDDFAPPLIARLLDKNPHASKESCKDAIGFNSVIAKNSVMELVKGLYPEDRFNFYPNLSGQIYLRNPYVKNMYIALNSYFEYIKKARVAELEMIADKLGAKYVKISYKESEKKFVSMEAGAKAEYGGTIGQKKAQYKENAKIDIDQSRLREIEVASKNEFKGHSDPVRPELVYFKNEDSIERLIESRMANNITSKTYMIKYNQSSDLNIALAAGIDAVLGKLKMGENASVKSEVERENRMYLEYEIRF